ncbi:DNA topoisomerase IB [Kitasatospora cineracea]|uniref:DNA topoisomerase n=1 Tax=Kitasatospora cineracea TaxID=88074 RepID=A0A8G1UAG2_9ACTN|nr:DNA topoisomerase IB [Kitasatospora cineracea]ROR35837.1 DNA topoisomerase IB [Kitasatospora cineracea]
MRLRTSDPHGPGYRRVRHGRGFRYLAPDGRPVTEKERARLKALAVPPAWTDVWICPHPDGHLQAVGTDAAGRRQYLYHPAFRARRDEAKHERVVEVAGCLPKLRAAVERDLAARGLGRERVLACAVRLLDLGLFRIGSDAYARDNGSYGLTTVLRSHVTLARGEVRFDYPAKSGRRRVAALADPPTRAVVRSLLRSRHPGERLLVHREGRSWREVHGSDLNAYLRETGGTDLTAKDFRTWNATVLAAVGLAVSRPAAEKSEAARRRAVARVVREVADHLGNTPAVCRASYINPRLVELFDEGVTIAPALDGLGSDGGPIATHGPVEDAVRALLS